MNIYLSKIKGNLKYKIKKMILTNVNIYTILIFIAWIIWIAYLFYRFYNQKIKSLKEYNFLPKINLLKYFLLIWSFIIVLFGIFHLKWWEKIIKTKVSGVDVMFALDVSKSMNTVDVKYWDNITTRLNLAKKAISDYIVKHPWNRYWLVIFAGNAIGSIPLTTDTDIFLTMLEGVNYKNLTKQWSDFEQAFSTTVNRFTNDKKRWKVLVFISDGWDQGDYKWISSNILDKIKKEDIKTFVVWVGSKQWWKILLWLDDFGDYNFQTYNWHYVITKLNTENLYKISKDINAKYIELDNIDSIDKIAKYIEKLDKKALETKNTKQMNDWTRYLIMFSFVLFLWYVIVDLFNLDFNKNKNA